MERKLKVLGYPSLIESMTMVDRFSDLPNGVAYRILSFLTIRDLTCFGIASKRCRALYLSIPSLELRDFLPKTTPTGEFRFFSHTTCEFRLRLFSSLDRFLLQRGDNRINYFGIYWNGHSDLGSDRTPCFCVNVRSQIIDWIHNAVRCNVEVLSFPCDVFLCATLRSLCVNMDGTIVKTPSVSFSSNIEYLELINVDIEDEGFFKWISCSCKFIKELILSDVGPVENIIIESSSLEKFEVYDHFYDGICTLSHLTISGKKLETIAIWWSFDSHSGTSLNMYAPKLKYLEWRGHLTNQANLGQLECLEKALICLEPKADDSDKQIKHFCVLHRVEHLVLNAATFKVSGFDKAYWKLQNLDFVDQIKKVTLVLDGSNNGIDFARYILEHAKNLEQMDIQYLLNPSDDAIQKLNESKKMSKATVIFEEDFVEDSDKNLENFDEDFEED
ncbi:F-box/LRR-repeat protein [Pyrus ussuriensis x Pyrus communis]|uniref:F-box/LRR-repeat protein n=1 Tax=Pyrus ussuriensis x Pyrus communis TaxID=2448454 RepID=A0A5N5HZ90_9ROSA|nr:F-box/LRR-repeat protein [Pyrus ussuriensis x Pyrus communis]